MRLVLFVLFIAFPMLEIALLVKLGSALGFWPSIGIIVATGILGSTVLRHQGFAVVRRSQEAIAAGKAPIEPVFDGMFLFAAGLLLITPGFLSDVIGLLLLIPPLRRTIARGLLRKFMQNGTVTGAVFESSREARGPRTAHTNPERSGPPRRPGARSGGPAPVIEGEFERVDEPSPPRRDRAPDA